MTIRPTRPGELEEVCRLYAQARQFMRENGNPAQWAEGYPSRALVEQDIAQGHSHVCEVGGQPACTFFFAQQEDPAYARIYHGAWLDDRPYGVAHRVASARNVRGAASFCLDWCLEQCGNLRIDTHENNLPMRRLLEKKGFVRCGVILLADGSERLAFQKRA